MTDDAIACYGLACPQRGTCERFSALGLADGAVIDSCQTRDGWPLYRPAGGQPTLMHYEPLMVIGQGVRWYVSA